eukprot:TRINITY_DN39010_c0_g1_i1.p2 TRINITY_DN39010_c0_g1~~TRINITY_DN39010_c0_g1_i1.p2  ORF type:complete len:106 (-),score=26.55 TRINITY_DN39010_c0_g1_i1:51-368(-)
MRYLNNTAHVQGMQERAVEVVHMLHHLGREGTQGLYCEHIEEPWYRIFDVDVYAAVAVMIFIFIHLVKWTMRTLCRCCRRNPCLLYTSDAADEEDSVDLGGRRII